MIGLVNLYLNVCTSYFLMYLKPTSVPDTCILRDTSGRLCCDKKTRSRYGFCCSYSHSLQKQFVARAPFNPEDWGAEYMRLLQGDVVIELPTNIDKEGWAYGQICCYIFFYYLCFYYIFYILFLLFF